MTALTRLKVPKPKKASVAAYAYDELGERANPVVYFDATGKAEIALPGACLDPEVTLLAQRRA